VCDYYQQNLVEEAKQIMAGRPIVHMEIVSNSPAAADKFYAEAFGWNIKVDPTFDYHQFQTSPEQGGAFIAPHEGNEQYPDYKLGQVLLYIGSDDIEADLVKIVELGGKVINPTFEIPGTGWMAVFQDPGGSRLALYKSM